MSAPFISEIKMFGGNFAPRNYANCDGQLLPITQNTALFSLLGTTFGGDGRSTVGLPNMMGRVPVHFGRGPGLTDRALGSKDGAEGVTLTTAQIASHNHGMTARSVTTGNGVSPANNSFAALPGGRGGAVNAYASTANAQLQGTVVTNTGGMLPHENRQPFQVIRFVIALQGLFPSRS